MNQFGQGTPFFKPNRAKIDDDHSRFDQFLCRIGLHQHMIQFSHTHRQKSSGALFDRFSSATDDCIVSVSLATNACGLCNHITMWFGGLFTTPSSMGSKEVAMGENFRRVSS